MPSLDFERIKRSIPLSVVLNHIGWRPIWSWGTEYRGGCPIHRSKSSRPRSFAVQGDGWYCHSCKKGGDQLRLWAELTRQAIVPATIALCKELHMPVLYLPRQRPAVRTRNGEEER